MYTSVHWSGWIQGVDSVTFGRLVQQCFIGWPWCRMVGDYTGLKTWDVKSNDNDNDHPVANKLKRWGESRCRPGAATCQSCSDCSWKLVNGSGIPDLQLCLCLCRCGCLCLCDLFVFAFVFPPLALPPFNCSSNLPSRLVREPDCHIETLATIRQCQKLKMTDTGLFN